MRRSWKYKVYLKFIGFKEEELRARGDGIVADWISAEAARHPNLLFGASVNPYRQDALARLKWAKERGAVLVKWIPSVMAIDPADPALEPFYRKLVEYKLPLLVHTGAERTFTRADDGFCDPARLELPLFRKYPNLYGDVSATTQFNRIGFLRKALAHPELKGRLVYGTDWPLQKFPIVWPGYQLGRVSPRELLRAARVKDVWDRDVALKKALGVPDEVLAAGWKVLGLAEPRGD